MKLFKNNTKHRCISCNKVPGNTISTDLFKTLIYLTCVKVHCLVENRTLKSATQPGLIVLMQPGK